MSKCINDQLSWSHAPPEDPWAVGPGFYGTDVFGTIKFQALKASAGAPSVWRSFWTNKTSRVLSIYAHIHVSIV